MAAPRIHVLPPELADQIAAGEVVERPASVVKELAENALDAGARRIDVDVENGGRALIRVVDDGGGMSAEEAHLSLLRHATSKLGAVEDLFALGTMGFRGEALPSIAAVSRLVLVTRDAEALAGYRLTADSGASDPGEPVGAPRGTRVEVRDLLYNVPARLKFLKAEATETAHIVDAIVRLALPNPGVHFRLRSGPRLLLDLPPHPSRLERARAVLGRRGAVVLHAAKGREGAIAVEAALGAPSESATTSRNTYVFVNRRFVRDRGLLHAVALGYGELLERGRYPMAVIHVDVPPGEVDVNVHPQKIEVRFARPQDVASALRHTIAAACARAPWLDEKPGGAVRVYALPPERPAAAGEGERGGEQRRRLHEALALFSPQPQEEPGGQTRFAPFAASPPVAAAGPSPPAQARGFFASLRYLGQLHRTYLVCEADGELVLIDQHAAHERVAFERLRTAHGEHRIRTQRLLFPFTLELDAAQAAVVQDHGSVLLALGFDVEPFGGGSVAVKALPEVLARGEDSPQVLTEILDDLAARGGSEAVADRLDHALATMACHAVVRAGDVLDDARVRALLESMDGVDFRAHCPHGRPVLLRLSVGELERRFGRT